MEHFYILDLQFLDRSQPEILLKLSDAAELARPAIAPAVIVAKMLDKSDPVPY